MAQLNWILTFDDGPLPSDWWGYDPAQPEALLQPLRDILDTLANHPAGPIQAVFFLRGPGYPWIVQNLPQPPDSLFQLGVELMLQAGHGVALHCYTHDPELWWRWPLTGAQIRGDLDTCLGYFSGLAPGQEFRLLRPPYGQGGLAVWTWAMQNDRRVRLWTIDSEDWRHHPDAQPFPTFEDDPASHLAHIQDVLGWKIAFHLPFDDHNDMLLHVSQRTASHLASIIDTIVEATEARHDEPVFTVPASYMAGDF